MLYRLVKILMTVALRFFYRHIHTSGLENVPAKGPAIIIANHASSLMDAALIGILLKRPIYYFARGDVFINKPITTILSWLHMMPVHNHDGGRKTLDVNESSFSEGQRILSKGGIIVFFPESTSHVERQLMTFRKGVFRLAFKTATDNNFSFDIPIIPFGITYDHPVRAGKEVQVHAGKPISLLSYKKRYEENASATLLQVSKHAYELVHQQVLHIASKDRLVTAEHCLETNWNNFYKGNRSSWIIQHRQRLETAQYLCGNINQAGQTNAELLGKRCAAYYKRLGQYKIEDRSISPAFNFPSRKIVLVCLGFPVYVAGMLLNALPVIVAKRIAKKKVSRIDFYSWIYVAVYAILYLIWIILLAISFLILFPVISALLLLAAVIASGLFSYYYSSLLFDYNQYRFVQRIPPDELNLLRAARSNLY